MAPQPATLKITFTSNYYAGAHIICYRIAGSGDPYVCVPVSCGSYIPPAVAPTCFLDIPVTVDNSTCDQVSYEGYVYPTCAITEEEIAAASTNFFITFTPDQPCSPYTITCTGIVCAAFEINTCNGTVGTDGPLVPQGYVVKGCWPADPSSLLPQQWTVVAETDCCYTCSTIVFTNTDPTNPYEGFYTDCATTEIVSTGPILPSFSVSLCGVTNSGYSNEPAITIGDTPGCA